MLYNKRMNTNPQPAEELLEIVDADGLTIGAAPRSEIHGNPALLHKVVHVLVFNAAGELLLQKRSLKKDVAPGRWDTSVGGHVDHGEDLVAAALREMREELGVSPANGLEHLYSYIHANDYESERVTTWRCTHNGPFSFNPDEIDEIRFFPVEELLRMFKGNLLSDNFKSELQIYLNRGSAPAPTAAH